MTFEVMKSFRSGSQPRESYWVSDRRRSWGQYHFCQGSTVRSQPTTQKSLHAAWTNAKTPLRNIATAIAAKKSDITLPNALDTDGLTTCSIRRA